MAKPSKSAGMKRKTLTDSEIIIFGEKVKIVYRGNVAFYEVENKLYFLEYDATMKIAAILGRPFMNFIDEFFVSEIED